MKHGYSLAFVAALAVSKDGAKLWSAGADRRVLEWDLATGRHRLLHPGVSGRWLASEPMPDA